MEVLAIVGGIVAIGQAAELTTRLARKLYRVTCKAEAIAQEMNFLACHLNTFSSTISSAHCTIRDHYESDKNSKTIKRLNDEGTFQDLAFQTEYLMRRVKGLKEKLKEYQGTPQLIARFVWMFKKGPREYICLWMSRVQGLFQSIITQIMYESLQKRLASNPSAQDADLCNILEEMQRCERMIKTHRKSMRVYKRRQQSLNYNDTPTRNERHSATISHIENTVLKMEDEIVMESAATRESKVSFSSASHQPFEQESSMDNQPSEQDSSMDNQSFEQESSMDHPPHTIDETNAFQSQGVLRHHQLQLASESLSSSVETLSIHIREEPQSDEALQWEEADYIAVQPSNRILRLYRDHDYQIVEGYINSKFSPSSANASRQISENVISELYATQLGLDIDYCESDDENDADIGEREMVRERRIDFGNGNIHSVIGRVSFSWKDSPQPNGLRPLKITCLVSRYMPPRTELVFGQPFFGRRKHYWGR